MDSLVGKVVADRFQVVRLLGRGGMGRVYEVELTQLKKRFAIKVLAKELAGEKDALLRFRREAEIVASLNHPNIIEIVDWATLDDGRPLYVMELLQGMDLEKRIKSRGPLPWEEIATIAAQCVSALLEAHRKGILHRDLKPTNVFITEHGSSLQVKLIDFGLARARDLAKITMYTTPKLIGTPAYMSPDQLQGKSAVGEEADCWAIAAVLYEAATGVKAFKGGYAELIYLIGKERPRPMVDLRRDAPSAFADVIAAALTPIVDRRITSLEELGDGIANSLMGQGGGVVKASLQSMARAQSRDEDREPGLPDTLPWGVTVEDAEPAGAAAGRRHQKIPSGKEEKSETGEPLVPLIETLPWGTVKPGADSNPPATDESIESAPLRQRSSQRLTKPERPPPILPVVETTSSSSSLPPPVAQLLRERPAETPARSPVQAPVQATNRSRRYGLWFALISGVGLLLLALLSTIDDEPKPSTAASEATPFKASMRVVELSSRGSLSKSETLDAVYRTLFSLEGCYEPAAKLSRENPAVSIEVIFTIDEQARATNVQVEAASLEGLSACVARAIKKVRTSTAPVGGTQSVKFLLRYTPVDSGSLLED